MAAPRPFPSPPLRGATTLAFLASLCVGCGGSSAAYFNDVGGCPDLDRVVSAGHQAAPPLEQWVASEAPCASGDCRLAPAGTLDEELVRAVVQSGTDGLLGCYAPALDQWPLAGGTVVVALIVGQDGTVANARVNSTDVPREIACCIRERTRTWRFAPPQLGDHAVIVGSFLLRSDALTANSDCAGMGPTPPPVIAPGCHPEVIVDEVRILPVR